MPDVEDKLTQGVVVEIKQEPQESFWSVVWGHIKRVAGVVWRFFKRYLLGPLPALLLVIGAGILIVMGAKNIQIGGLLAKLLGRKDGEKAIDVANSVPSDRVREDGTLIKPGESDDKGMTQAVIVAIEKPGMFSNPDTVKIKAPGEDKPVTIDLPTGVKARDVDKVIIVKPKVYAITVTSESKVSASEVDDLLSKYGG